MNIHEMTIKQLENIEITSVEQGRKLADDILREQKNIHRQMVGLYDNKMWSKLCRRHYELRKIRYSVLLRIGTMATNAKKN